jgi:hypothetical protein
MVTFAYHRICAVTVNLPAQEHWRRWCCFDIWRVKLVFIGHGVLLNLWVIQTSNDAFYKRVEAELPLLTHFELPALIKGFIRHDEQCELAGVDC